MGDSPETEQQLLEVEALQSIYNEEEFITYNDNKTGLIHVQFYAFITLPNNFSVVFNDCANDVNDIESEAVESGSNNQNDHNNILEVKHLPPVELLAILPKDYPTKTAPQFTLSCSWLSIESLSKLCKKLDDLWNENKSSEILYIWTIFLKEETLVFLELENIVHISKSSLKHDDIEQRPQSKRNKESRLHNVEAKYETDSGVEVIDNTVDDICSNSEVSDDKFCADSMNKCDKGGVNESFDDSEITCSQVTTNKCIEVNTHEDEQSELIPCDIIDKTNNNIPVSVNENDDINRTHNKNQGYSNRYFYNNFGSTSDDNKTSSPRKYNCYYKQHNNYYPRKTRYNYNKSSGPIHKDVNHSHQNNDNASSCKDSYINDNNSAGFKKSHYRGRYRRRFNGRDGNYSRRDGCYHDGGIMRSESDKNSDANRGKDKCLDVKTVCTGSDSVLRLQEKMTSELILSSDACFDSELSSSSNSVQSCSLDLPSGDSVSEKSSLNKNLNESKSENIEFANDENSVNNEKKNLSASIDNKDRRVKKNLSQYYVKNLLDYLESYNQDRILTEFRKMFFSCSICYQDKLGIHCTQFKPCDHTFCKDCVSQYVQIKINEGTVYVIKCPEDKCTSDIMPSQVRDLVGPEQFAVYDKILLTTTLETMTDIVTCPRRTCQYPATRDPDEKMAICPACQYVFCAYCKMGYHGVEPCRFRTDEKAALIKEYLEGKDDMKLALEQRYGRRQLISLVQASLSESWIFNNSQTCPHCNASIEKSGGCNKMVCWRCSTFFCWICQARLDPNTPYKHYYDPKSQCRNQLFEGVVSDDDEEDILIFDDEDFED